MKTSFFGWAMGIVAVSALVACGDDTTAGTGGGGGEGQGGATTATTTTTTTTTSSTGGEGGNTTTTSSTGGEGGSGGEGGGTPLDCTEVTVDEIVNQSGDGVGFYFSTLSPNFGGEGEDYLLLEFYEGDGFDGAQPGTYDLSEEQNYAECSRCIRSFQDFDPAGEEDAAKKFMQVSGTFELAEAGNLITSGFATFSLTDVTLVEVEIDPETLETTPVAGGDCLHIESFEYDNPKIVPETWTCDPSFYEAADGCDCDCGAYDPDCDAPATVYGCDDPALPYCDATGACAETPTWWECDAAELNDGATCNCMCGGPDPDCDPLADLPVDGCANVNQTCSADGTMCLNPESVCDDFTDNDNDGSFDCADASSCQGTPACTPGVTPQNGECDANSDCLALLDPLCITNDNLGTNASFCSQWCNLEADDCGGTEFCYDLGVQEGICLTTCTEAGDECPAEFFCAEVGEGIFGCLPDVPAGWTCDPAYYGASDGCDCGCGVVDPDCADATDASCDYCSAESCGNDGSDFGCDLAEINDANNAVCN